MTETNLNWKKSQTFSTSAHWRRWVRQCWELRETLEIGNLIIKSIYSNATDNFTSTFSFVRNGKMWWKDLKNFHFLFEETICLCGTHFRFFLSFFERKCGKWMPDRQTQSEFAYMYVCGTSVSIVIVNPHKIPGVMAKHEIFHSHRNHSLNRP